MMFGTWQWQSARYTIAFQSDGSLFIRADCNNVLGTYSVAGATLNLRLGPSTLVACPEDSLADEFVAGLSQVSSYTEDGDILELGLTGGGRMRLAPHALPPLAGPTWQVTGYNNGREAVQSVLADSQITAVFGEDGRVTGFAGCNRYTGPYETDGASLSVGPLASTRMLCEAPLMQQETAFLKALEATTQYGFENDSLVLRDGSGATQAMLVLRIAR